MPGQSGQTQAVSTFRPPRRSNTRCFSEIRDVSYSLTVSAAVGGSNYVNFTTSNGTVPQMLTFGPFQREAWVTNLTSQVAWLSFNGSIPGVNAPGDLPVRSGEQVRVTLSTALPNCDQTVASGPSGPQAVWTDGAANDSDQSLATNWGSQTAFQIGYLGIVLAANPAANTSVIVVV